LLNVKLVVHHVTSRL